MALTTGLSRGSYDYEQSLIDYEYRRNQQRFYELQKQAIAQQYAMQGLGNYQPAGIAPPHANKEVSNTDLILLIEETQDEA